MKRHPDGYLVKLVRDRVRKAVGGDGTVDYRRLPPDEHVKRLRAKLAEEALEYALDPSLAELAHVMAVVEALAVVDLGVSTIEVEEQMLADYDERGGFLEGVGMYVTHPWDHEEEETDGG